MQRVAFVLCNLLLASKTLNPNQIAEDSKQLLLLLCQQGKHLERSCHFYLALKYYFAGLHYFSTLKRSQPALQLDPDMQALSRSFQSLFDNLLPLSNQQVCSSRVMCPLCCSGLLCFCLSLNLVKNLLCYALQVYEQARTTVEYQRGVMQRGTMMK
jgi:hypothetical protein